MEAAGADSVAAMTAARAAGDPAAELDAIRARVAALSAPQHRTQWLRLGARAVELAVATGQPIAAVLGRVWRIDASYQLMNLEAVDTEIALIAQLAESTRLPLARWHLLRQQASRAALAGQFATARDRSEQARLLAVRIQDLSGVGMSHAFALALASLRGDATELRPEFFDVLANAPPIPIIRASRATALFVTGRAEEARAVYETLRQLPAAGDVDVRTLGSLNLLLDLIIAFRDTATAQATYDLFRPLADQGGTVGSGLVSLDGSVHWPLGRLAALLGRTEQALDHFASALAVNTRLGARPFVVMTRLDWAQTLAVRAAGDDLGQARELARQAAAEAHRLDMPGPASRADRLARELQQAIGAASPLTRREREITGLISAGLTNRGIADRLVLSERTVEGHVRSTLAKLQLTNRTELAAWALREARLLTSRTPGREQRGPPLPQLSHRTHAEQLHGPLELRGQDVQHLVHPRLPASHQAVQVGVPDGAGVRAQRERHRDVRPVPHPGVDQHGYVRPHRLADRRDRLHRRHRPVQLAAAMVGQLHASALTETARRQSAGPSGPVTISRPGRWARSSAMSHQVMAGLNSDPVSSMVNDMPGAARWTSRMAALTWLQACAPVPAWPN